MRRRKEKQRIPTENGALEFKNGKKNIGEWGVSLTFAIQFITSENFGLRDIITDRDPHYSILGQDN